MSGENGQGWITEEASLTVSTGATSATAQGGKDEPIVTCRKTRVPEEHGR